MPFRTRSRNVFIINFVRVSGVTGSPCVVHQVSNASTSTSTLMGRIPCASRSRIFCSDSTSESSYERAKFSLSSAISRRRSHCSGRYQLTPMINVLLSRCCLMVCHIFHCFRLLSMTYTPQRHLAYYDGNDHVASQLPFVSPLGDDTTF